MRNQIPKTANNSKKAKKKLALASALKQNLARRKKPKTVKLMSNADKIQITRADEQLSDDEQLIGDEAQTKRKVSFTRFTQETSAQANQDATSVKAAGPITNSNYANVSQTYINTAADSAIPNLASMPISSVGAPKQQIAVQSAALKSVAQRATDLKNFRLVRSGSGGGRKGVGKGSN
jgi:hypothetical protein